LCPSEVFKLVLKCVHVFTPRLFRTARLTAAALLPRGRRAWLGSFPDSPSFRAVWLHVQTCFLMRSLMETL